jgi:ferredoxin-NADP reductase
MQNNDHFILVATKKEAEDIKTLSFEQKKPKKPFHFTAGQYVAIHIPDNPHILGEKQYTISSAPHEPYFDITVKRIGLFSGALHDLNIGDEVTFSEPEGYFRTQDEISPLVLVAAGIGITPFYSIIKDIHHAHKKTPVTLFYTIRTPRQGAFIKELKRYAEAMPNLSVHIHTTAHNKRITAKDIIDQKTCEHAHFFICGPNQFVVDMWKGLKEKHIPENRIFLESFF